MSSTNSTAAPPPGSPPGGPPVDPALLDHDNTGPRMLIAIWITWSIAFVFVALRFWTRGIIVRKLGAADWFIGLSFVAATGMCVAMVEEIKHGMGKHIWDINLMVDGISLIKAWWFSILTYNLTLALTKISICLLYLTIFTFEWVRKASWALLGVVVVTNVWGIISIFTHCIPLEASWDLRVKSTFCQPQTVWWMTTGFAIGTDLVMVLLPIPAILPLKLPPRQKMVVVGIFVIGFFECIVSFVRLGILIQNKVEPLDDVFYTGTELTYWTVIEVHTAIVIACLMTLKPLVTKFIPFMLRSEQSTEDDSSAAASDPPLTIGSRPLRNMLGHPRPDSWVEVEGRPVAGIDRPDEDIEAKAGRTSSDGASGELARTDEKDMDVAEIEVKPPNTGFSEASSRSDDLRPTAIPHAIG